MTDMKNEPNLREWQEKIAGEADQACDSIRRRAEEAIASVKTYASSIGNIDRMTDLIAKAEVALVNDVVLDESWGPEFRLRVQADASHYALLNGFGEKILKPGKKRVIFFVIPTED